MVNIFLDDCRETPPGFIRAYTVQECLALLVVNVGRVNTLSLDNDLAIPGLENEGREVCNWLAERLYVDGADYWPKEEIVIHSGNPVARDYMSGVITRYAPGFWKTAPHIFTRA
jgi:hypothetical protein